MGFKRFGAVFAFLLLAACARDSAIENEGGGAGEMTTTASGLQYQVLEEGDGPKPTASDTVTVHYKGELEDGTVFDSSYERGEPTSFPVGKVIKGWTEGLQLMSVGGKYVFHIPAELGYGEKGGGPIPPNAKLVFQVELLEINGQ